MSNKSEVVDTGWVSVSKSGKSLTIRIMDQLFFVSLKDLDSVLQGYRYKATVKQWVEQQRKDPETDEWNTDEW
ncbi:MAG: hypothetical protein PVF96_07100 [Candidatus Bathyarchaeota archaeon]|jgi:hypothetical protein